MKNIVLTGIMGCGKSTVGRQLAKKINFRFIDLDHYIERMDGRIISQIFEQDGEVFFRGLEEQALRRLSNRKSTVIATGGGTVLNSKNVSLLKKNGLIYFLNRPITTIVATIRTAHRPLLTNGAEILYDIYAKRLPVYLETCDVEIQNDISVSQALYQILEHYQHHLQHT